MSKAIPAQARAESGKGVSRRLRNEGMVPAVIYGSGQDPQPIAIDSHTLFLTMKDGGFFTHVHTLSVDGKDEKVLARDVQRHPVKDDVEHVDFLRYDAKRKLKVMVVVHVINEEQSPGLKTGGILQIIRNEVELLCRADSIPESIEVDVAGFEVGDSAKISSVTLPEGVEPTITDRDFAIASVVSPKTSQADEEEDAALEAAAEGEEGDEGEAKADGEEKAHDK